MQAWLSSAWYEFIYLMSAMGATLGLSLRTEGRKNVPAAGPVLLIANHQSYLDPVLVALSTRRHLDFLARKTLFRHPLFAWLIDSLHAVPIDQEGVGKEGIRTILQRLEAGRAVLVFPEGTRTPDGRIHELRPGIQLLIKRTEARIVPVGIAGAYDAWPTWRKFPLPAPLFLPATRRTVAVSVGEPMDARPFAAMPRGAMLGALTEALQNAWARAERLRRKT